MRPSDLLQKGGLNRALFLPFIDLIGRHMDVLALDAATDYRRLEAVFDHGLVHATRSRRQRRDGRDLQPNWTGGAAAVSADVPFRGRRIHVPRAAAGVARFDFADLCGRPLAADYYLALAGCYHTFLIDGVPLLDETRRNEARRFIHLVDALYDRRLRLIASAAAPPGGIYRAERGQEAFEFTRTDLASHRDGFDGISLQLGKTIRDERQGQSI